MNKIKERKNKLKRLEEKNIRERKELEQEIQRRDSVLQVEIDLKKLVNRLILKCQCFRDSWEH